MALPWEEPPLAPAWLVQPGPATPQAADPLSLCGVPATCHSPVPGASGWVGTSANASRVCRQLLGAGRLALTLGSAPPEPIGPARLCPPTLPTGRAWGAGRQRQLGAPSHRTSACGVCTSAPCWPRPLVVSPRPSGAAEVGGVSSGPSQRPPLTRGPCSAPVPGRHGLCPRTHSTVKPWVTRQNRHVHGLPGEPRATAPAWRVRAAACLLPPSRGLAAPTRCPAATVA